MSMHVDVIPEDERIFACTHCEVPHAEFNVAVETRIGTKSKSRSSWFLCAPCLNALVYMAQGVLTGFLLQALEPYVRNPEKDKTIEAEVRKARRRRE